VYANRQLAEHFHKSSDLISEEELRQYFLHIKNVKNYSTSGITIALCEIKFFFEHTLEKKLPVVLSPEEVRRILRLASLQSYRTCLSVIYSCGLRLQRLNLIRISFGNFWILGDYLLDIENNHFREPIA
jgi:integrase/recombinase XerD